MAKRQQAGADRVYDDDDEINDFSQIESSRDDWKADQDSLRSRVIYRPRGTQHPDLNKPRFNPFANMPTASTEDPSKKVLERAGLNKSFAEALNQKLAADPTANLCNICQEYLDHRKAIDAPSPQAPAPIFSFSAQPATEQPKPAPSLFSFPTFTPSNPPPTSSTIAGLFGFNAPVKEPSGAVVPEIPVSPIKRPPTASFDTPDGGGTREGDLDPATMTAEEKESFAGEKKPVSGRAGEEDEETLFEENATMSRVQGKEFVGMGCVSLHLNRNKVTGVGRIIARTEETGRVLLNCWINSATVATLNEPKRAVLFKGHVRVEPTPTFMFRFRQGTTATSAYSHLMQLIQKK